MSIIIHSTNMGFFTQTAVGTQLAPMMFLSTLQNNPARIVALDGATIWQNIESLGATSFQYTAQLSHSIAPATIGEQRDIQIAQITLSRFENENPITIATLSFETPLTVTATYSDAVSGTLSGWYTDIAQDVIHAVQHSGLTFIGSGTQDIFTPENEPLYYTQTTIVRLRGGDDVATGTHGNDRLIGGRGDDVLFDNGGENLLRGGQGDDHLSFGTLASNSVARGGTGHDTLVSSHGNDRLFGGSGNDIITGNNGRDILRGGTGDDHLSGGHGDDILSAGSGDDRLFGGRGNDVLMGGLGQDVFVFYQNIDGHDRIRDFNPEDDTIALPDWLEWQEINFTQAGNHTRITLDGEDFSLMVLNTDITDFSATNVVISELI